MVRAEFGEVRGEDMKEFFNSPYNFSFKDLVAGVFIGSFLFFCWKSLNSSQALELVQSLVSLIGIILGGYFVQEGAAMYFQRTQDPGTTPPPPGEESPL